jgi:hypothetical protein
MKKKRRGARYRVAYVLGDGLYVVDTFRKERCFEFQDRRGYHSARLAKILGVGELSHEEVGKMICTALNIQEKAKRLGIKKFGKKLSELFS